MKQYMMAALLLSLLATAAQAEINRPLSAVVTHESRILGNDGVTREMHYQDRMVRDSRNVWVERLLPASHNHDTEEEGGHKHLDVAEAAQHYRQDTSGRTGLVLVLKEEKTAVHMQDADIEMAGFSKCWPCVYSLAVPDVLKGMTVVSRSGDLVWYEKKGKAGTVKIQWDGKNQIARELETRSADGRNWQRTRVALQPAPAALPWNGYKAYISKDYADFGD